MSEAKIEESEQDQAFLYPNDRLLQRTEVSCPWCQGLMNLRRSQAEDMLFVAR
jgi:hypothetical protein